MKPVKVNFLRIDILSMSCIGWTNLKQKNGIFFGRWKKFPNFSDKKPPLGQSNYFFKLYFLQFLIVKIDWMYSPKNSLFETYHFYHFVPCIFQMRLQKWCWFHLKVCGQTILIWPLDQSDFSMNLRTAENFFYRKCFWIRTHVYYAM